MNKYPIHLRDLLHYIGEGFSMKDGSVMSDAWILRRIYEKYKNTDVNGFIRIGNGSR